MSRIKINRFIPLKAIMHQSDNEYLFIDENDNITEITRADAMRMRWHFITMVPLEKIKYIEEFNRCEVDGVRKCQIDPLLLKDFGEALIPKAAAKQEVLEKLNKQKILKLNAEAARRKIK